MVMSIETAIKERRSVRKYTTQKIAAGDLEMIVDAIRYAPTASNSQAWRFHVVTDEACLHNITTFAQGIWSKPPAVLIISMNREKSLERSGSMSLDETIYYDAGIAAYAASLMAMSLGLGSCIVASFNREVISRLLNICYPHEPLLMLTLGYEAGRAVLPKKLPLEKVLDRSYML